MPDVTLRPLATSVRRRFLVRAMTNAALHLRGAGGGLAASVVYDANDLAHAAAGARVHGGAPVSDGRFRLRTAALAEDFSNCRHQHPASDSHVPPRGAGSRIRKWAQKGAASPGQTSETHALAPGDHKWPLAARKTKRAAVDRFQRDAEATVWPATRSASR